MKRLGITFLLLMFVQSIFASMPYHTTTRSYSQPTKSYSQPAPARGCSLISRYFSRHPVEQRRPGIGRPLQLPPPPPKKISLNRALPYVDSVFIQGGIDLQIIGNQPVNKISFKALYPGLTVKVCDTSIYISNSKPVSCNQNPRPKMRIRLNQLKQLVVAGDSCVNGCNLNTSCGLIVESCGCGMINLEGPVQLIRVTNTGSANIFIPCVRSDHVHILATRAGVVRLRGYTDLLLVRAFQGSYVDTRFMCSNTAMVQAGDRALVTLKTSGSLQAFASGMSNVYYYMTPGTVYQHTKISGNVFQMGDGY